MACHIPVIMETTQANLVKLAMPVSIKGSEDTLFSILEGRHSTPELPGCSPQFSFFLPLPFLLN